jgi:glycosyltransferase involved in cell wall biosynthesis
MTQGPARLVIVSPLPPSPSGIAAYTAELVPELARHCAVTVVLATEADVAAAPQDLPVRLVSERAWRADPGLQAMPHLHQLGNSLDHAHVYRAALSRPGVVVLHDVVLHHLVEALTLGRGSPHAYAAALAAEYGPAGRRLARLRELGLFAPMQRFLMPLNGAVLARARGVVVHSRFAAGRLGGPAGLPVRILPHHLSPAIAGFDGVSQAEARARLGLPADERVLLLLGHVTPAKQAGMVLRALALLARDGPPLLVVGGQVEAGLDIAGDAAAHGLGGRVRLTGWLADEAFFLHLRAADLLLALRFPTAGESSGTLARALGMGTPALVYDVGPAAEYPDSVLAKLPFSADAAAPLAIRIGELLGDAPGLAALGAEARAWMRTACSPAASAAAYLDCLSAWG